jgi:predicted transcriptional regulator
MEKLGDLLFELSNDDRRRILLSIREKPKRLTQISQSLDLTIQEASRQLSRLEEVGLEYKDAKGYHYLTPYGELILRQLRGFEFTSQFKEFFMTHSLDRLTREFVDRIGDLSKCRSITNAMDFLRHTESLFKEADEHVWLLVDQFPINSLSTIIEAIERGVQFKIIEPVDRVLSPDIDSMTSEEAQALSRARHTPLVEHKMIDTVNVFLYLSEKRCILAFPTSDGQCDYSGFIASDDTSLKWCRELFQHYWDEGEKRMPATSGVQVKRGGISERGESLGLIVVEGRENPDIDVQAVQDAVDNFDEVILRGTFNFGSSYVMISRSVVIRGEECKNDIPTATVYKKGWKFPFREFDYVFLVNGENADVTIENIQFTDFNCSCIRGWRGNSMCVKDNWITLETGYGRGLTLGPFGDLLMGISIESGNFENFKGGIRVEGNYINFRRGGIWGGHVSRGGLEEDPEYRPDLFNHEYYIGIGIVVNNMPGIVRIENNIIRNANGRGITSSQHHSSANVQIRRNIIESDVYGSYSFSSDEAGVGIVSYSARSTPGQGFHLEIEDNTIKFDKLNHSGIVVLGPITDLEGSDKLRGGIIRNNHIQLKNGYEGIHVRMCDDFEMERNVISGGAYYGIKISGRNKSGKLDLRALKNTVKDNDMCSLQIRAPDEYGDSHVDGRMFTGSEGEGKSATSHVWLNKYSARNTIHVKDDETVIDEGTSNSIVHL